MRGISLGHSHQRPCTAGKTLRRCRNNEEADHVILIDGDSENFDNVIIIDLPESLPKKSQSSSILSKDNRWPFQNVINLDDDEDDESPDCNNQSDGVNNVNFCAGTSSNRESHRASNNSADFVQDNATPVRLSKKSKRTYSGKASSRNSYGLDADSESDSSDNDYPDCVLVEDPNGDFHKLWEQNFSRRKKDIPSGNADIRHQNTETKDATKEHKEGSCGFSTREFNIENDASSPFRAADDYDFEDQETSQVKPCQPVDKDSCNGKSSPIVQEEDKDEQNEDTLPSEEMCIFNEREKMKETDEYKRAEEEEWASRQKALQIQAEEAQHEKRMRKRLKAESMRLLDMERRQKERVEEIRSIQKKDEENMNMKEIIRTEVRKQLDILEMTCHSMGYLLHSLGISVGGWPSPLPKEVQTAYKRALLTFHPDRASKSDIRQQVEAEEKFKLINRLKEKFKLL